MQNLQTCKVLIVDDTVENIDILVETLGEKMEVIVAVSGESALEAVIDEKPDLILLDIEMPEMDGFQVLSHLKSDPATTHIPVVFLSARSESADMNQGLAMGAVDYITKPFAISMVLEKVIRILGNKKNTYGKEQAS